MDTIKFTDDHVLYGPPSTGFVEVDVPAFPFLIRDGRGRLPTPSSRRRSPACG